MNSQTLNNKSLPDKSGVYFFKKGKEILFIGKATSLRSRVKSYFDKDLINTRGPLILDMVTISDDIDWQVTDSVLEAIILEANLIKKYQPKYNTKEKDNKSFNYVCINKDKIPKVLIIRGRNLKKENYQSIYGPFPNGILLKDAMKIIRKIFPYVDDQSSKRNNIEFYKQLGLIPDITPQQNTFQKVLGSPRPILLEARPDHFEKHFAASLKQYKNNIKNLKLFFEGKKKSVISNLRKEMKSFAQNKEFEKAGEIKKRIFAIEHINDVALIKEDTTQKYENFSRFTPKGPYTDKNFHISVLSRIEAYDVAHMGGKNMVGVMTVIENSEIKKSEYKKFIIKTQIDSNDTGALEEILSRRFRHTEWGLPDLIVLDGSTAQMNVAKRVLNRYQYKIPIVAVVKDDKHKVKAIMGNEEIINKNKKSILLANSESHRFAITYHKQKRNKNFLN